MKLIQELLKEDMEQCIECDKYRNCDASGYCKSCAAEQRKNTGVNEAWAKPAKVKHTGRNTKQSVATLKKQRTKAKKSGNTKAVKQKNFAIRAKTGWGKAK